MFVDHSGLIYELSCWLLIHIWTYIIIIVVVMHERKLFQIGIYDFNWRTLSTFMLDRVLALSQRAPEIVVKVDYWYYTSAIPIIIIIIPNTALGIISRFRLDCRRCWKNYSTILLYIFIWTRWPCTRYNNATIPYRDDNGVHGQLNNYPDKITDNTLKTSCL